MESQFPPGESFSAISKQSGFNFSLYKGRVDWKKLGAIDVDRLISEKDLELLSDLLRNVTNLNLESDFDVKVLDPDFVKLFRISQLSVDFLLHCKNYFEKCLSDSQHKLNVAVQEVNSLRRVCEERKIELRRVKKQLREQTTSLLRTSHKCYICGKVFIEEAYLQSHHSRRHPDRTYMSPECNDSSEAAAMLRTEIKQLKERLNFAELQLNKRFEGTSPRLGNGEVENETSSLKEDVMALRNLLQSEIKKLKDNGKQDKVDYSCKNQDVENIPIKNTAEVSTNTDSYNEQENLANILARFLSTANRGGNGDNGQESNNISKTLRAIPDRDEYTNVTNYNSGKATVVRSRDTAEKTAATLKSSVASEERIVEAQITKSSERVESLEPESRDTETCSKNTFNRITMVTPKASTTEEVEDETSTRNQYLTKSGVKGVNNLDHQEKHEVVPRSRKDTVPLQATKSRTFSVIGCEDVSASESDVKTSPEIVVTDSGRVDGVVPHLEPPRPKPRSRTGNKSQSSDGSVSEVVKISKGDGEIGKVVKDLEVRSISSAEDPRESEVESKLVTSKQPSLQKRGLFSQKSVWHDDILEENRGKETLEHGDGRKTPVIFVTQSSDELKPSEGVSNPQRTHFFATSEITEFVEETSSDLDESVRNVHIEKVKVIDRSAVRTNTSVLSSSLGSSKDEDCQRQREPIETVARSTNDDERDKKDVGNMFGTPLNEKQEKKPIDKVDRSKTKADKTPDVSMEKRLQERITDSDDSALIVPESDSVGANVQLLLATNPEILQTLRSDLENMLGGRLRDLGVDPEWTQLPDRTYRDKKAALDHHKNIVAKRYPNYFKLQKQIEESLEHYFSEKASFSDLGGSSSGYPFAATSTPRSTSDASSQLRMTISDSESDSESTDSGDSQGDNRQANPTWPAHSSLKSQTAAIGGGGGGAQRQPKRVVFMDELSSGRSTPRVIGVHSVVVASSDNQSKLESAKRLHRS